MKLSPKQLFFVVGVLSVLKFLYCLLFINDFNLFEDHSIAVNIANTGEFFIFWDGVNNYTFQFPIFPYTVSILYKIFGIKPLAVIVLNLILNFFTAILLYKVFSFFFRYFKLPETMPDKCSAVINLSILLFAFHPVINYYALYNVHPFSMDLFFLFATLYTCCDYYCLRTTKKLLIAGLITGLAIMDRATLGLAALPLFFLLWKEEGLVLSVKKVSIIFITGVFVCLPWLIRNYNTDGIIGFESTAGRNLWKGVLSNSEGSCYLLNGKDYYSIEEQYLNTINKLSPKEQNQFFVDRFMEIWTKHPKHAAKMYLLKLRNFWLFRPQIGNEYSASIQRYIPVYLTGYFVALALSLLALFMIGKRSLYLFSLPLGLSFFQSFFYVETRHRLIIEPILIFLSLTVIYLLKSKMFRLHSE